MTTFEKMIKMYEAVNGEISQREKDRFEPMYNLDWHENEVLHEEVGIKYVKDGNTCFEITKADLLFDYLTLGL